MAPPMRASAGAGWRAGSDSKPKGRRFVLVAGGWARTVRVAARGCGRSSSTGVSSTGPRRLRSWTASVRRTAPGRTSRAAWQIRRKGAGEDSCWAGSGRTTKTRPLAACAASCSRRNCSARTCGKPSQQGAEAGRFERLFDRPEPIFGRLGAYQQHVRQGQAQRLQCRAVRQMRRGNQNQAAPALRRLAQGRGEQAPFTDAGPCEQEFGQGMQRPAAAGQFGIERGMTTRHDRLAVAFELVGTPQAGRQRAAGGAHLAMDVPADSRCALNARPCAPARPPSLRLRSLRRAHRLR